MYTLKTLILTSALTLNWSIVATAQEEEPTGVSPATEIQLIDITPTIRDIAVRLDGTEKEEKQLVFLRELVNKILATSKPKVVRVPMGEEPPVSVSNKQGEKVVITLRLQPIAKDAQQYKLTVVLQENEGEAGKNATFDYAPEQVDTLQQQLEAFLFEQLNLQSIAKPMVHPTEELTEPTVSPEPTVQTPIPSPSEEENSAPTVIPPPEKESSTPVIQEEDPNPTFTSPEDEVQLRNLTPSTRDISISVRGTEKEQAVLKTIQDMVNDIFNNARVTVIRVPTTEEPVTTPVIKVYENLEIVISAHSPSVPDEPYKINIALQEKETEQGNFKIFNYFPDKSQDFYEQLRAYLFEQAHLQPK